jgi:thiol-disulfide isomerase/thioredoxin
MNRFLLLAATVVLCSCSGESTTKIPSNIEPSGTIDLLVNVKPVSGLSSDEMEAAAQTEYDELDVEFKERMATLKQTIQQADSKEEQARLLNETNPASEISTQFMTIAKRYPGTQAARDAVLFAVAQTRGKQKDEAMNHLLDHYAERVQLAKIVDSLTDEIPSQAIENWFHKIIDRATESTDRAHAINGFARYVRQMEFYKKTLDYNPAYAGRLPAEQLNYINRPRTDAQKDELASLLTAAIEEYSELGFRNETTYGEIAERELFELENLQVGCVAPDIEGQDLDEIPFKLSDYHGKVVMLDFWGHWCPPCRAMYDQERFVTRKLADKPFALIGVNSDRKLDHAREAVSDESLSWRHFWNGEGGTNGEISSTWNVEAWPTVYLIDQNGVIRFKGVLGEEIDAGLEFLLAEMGHEVELTENTQTPGPAE